MGNRLDNLFRDMLSKHEESPSTQAWDQIHGQLASNKRKVWGKRLAVAASILLFATVGYIGYRSINSLSIKKAQYVINAIEENDNSDNSIPFSEELTTENTNSIQYNTENLVAAVETQAVVEDERRVEKLTEISIEVPAPVEEIIEEEMPLPAEVVLDNSELQNEIKVEEQEAVNEKSTIREAATEELLTENMDILKEPETIKTQSHKKTYSQVKIIYKATENSELIVSGKRKLMDKGIDKITRFSNEYLLTPDRKTKLRNTKEDLLAMNFGKLLNKSNKEIEN